MKKPLDKITDELLKIVRSTGKLAAKEIPSVCKEIVASKMVELKYQVIACSCLSILFLLTLVASIIAFNYCEGGAGKFLAVVGLLVSVVGTPIALLITTECFISIKQLEIAPRKYLIDYIRNGDSNE